jgi:hypothetical protein
MGYVYFIRHGDDDVFKIGITSGNVEDRLRQLQTGTPEKLTLYTYIKHPDPAIKERELHEKLKDRRINGEWFGLSPQEIRDILEDADIPNRAKSTEDDEEEFVELSQGHRKYVYNTKTGELFVAVNALRGGSSLFYALAISVSKFSYDGIPFFPFDCLIEMFPESEPALREQKGFILGSVKSQLAELR